jgi:hypothetical protein
MIWDSTVWRRKGRKKERKKKMKAAKTTIVCAVPLQGLSIAQRFYRSVHTTEVSLASGQLYHATSEYFVGLRRHRERGWLHQHGACYGVRVRGAV